MYKGKALPVQTYYSPSGLQHVEALRYQYNRHVKVVRFAALRIGRLYAPETIPGIQFS